MRKVGPASSEASPASTSATQTAAQFVGSVPATTLNVTLRAIFRRFWPLTKPLRGRLYVTLVLIVASPVLSTAGIGMFKILVDRVLVPHNFHLFPRVALLYLGLTVAQGVVSFIDQYLSTWIGEQFVMNLRERLFSHVHRLSVGFVESRPLGDLLSRLTGDIGAIENVVLSGTVQGLTYVIKLVLFTGAMFYLDWRLAAASLVAAPGFLLAARVFSRRIKVASREKRRRSAGITSVAEESFSNVALVRAYDRAEGEGVRFHEQNAAVFSAQMTATRLQALFAPLTDLIEVLGVLLVVGLAVWELAAGRITIGGLLVFMAYLAQLYSPIQGLSGLANSLYAASASAERVIELLEEQPPVIEPATPHPLVRAAGAVGLHQVGFTYPGANTAAVAEISVDIAAGQILAVVGASGAGKSTLAKLLLRFYELGHGSITLDGIDLRELSLTVLYRNVATVLQETLVFNATVRENILWGHPGATESQVRDAARAADAHDFITALPQGYDTQIGQRGRKLSGGQRQRLAIARAMIRDAPVLLLDEPTTGLDAEAASRVLQPLRRLIDGRTTIIISHNLLTVTAADTILYLERGRVAGTGTHSELLAQCPGYRHLYQLHQQQPLGQGSVSTQPPLGTSPSPQSPTPEQPLYNGRTDVSPEPPYIQFSRIHYRYPDTTADTLAEVSFSLRRGGCLAIEGPSGAGKSTLLRLLTRQLQPSAGTIRFDGIDLDRLDPHWLRQRVALISAEPDPPTPAVTPDAMAHLIAGSGEDTIQFDRHDLRLLRASLGQAPASPDRYQHRGKVEPATGAESAIGMRPATGMEPLAKVERASAADPVGAEPAEVRDTSRSSVSLSHSGARILTSGHRGGELLGRRLAAIHRALLTNPDVLLVDNPTDGLDPYDRNELLATLYVLAANHTMLLVSYDPVVRALADDIVRLKVPVVGAPRPARVSDQSTLADATRCSH